MSKSFQAIAAVFSGFAILFAAAAPARSAEQGPLELETKVPLGDVRGRIDHMAVDLNRQRLFIAELGNDSVGVVDLANSSWLQTILGLSEPQGVGYEPSSDTLFVANAGDGSVRLLDGASYKTTGQIELGSDADNIRIDTGTKQVLVGFGNGALAVLNPSTRSKVRSIPSRAHPESFQIIQGLIFVNLPDIHAIAVADAASGKQVATWPMAQGGNFAMAADRDRDRIVVAFRSPSELAVFASTDGKPIATIETCGDVDDLFVDEKRSRVYASCGEGYVDMFGIEGATYQRIGRVPTVAGARTSLFVPELDRLLVAVPASPVGPAAVWAFKSLP